MGNVPMRLDFPLHNLDVSTNGNRDDEKAKLQHSMHQQLIQSSTTLMGSKPPPLYEAALVGNWKDLLDRLASHPSEASYADKCKNTPLHLVCRRQPPPEVVNALIHADFDSSKSILQKTTVDGLSALHFACYCGAEVSVVEMLLGMKTDLPGSISRPGSSSCLQRRRDIYSKRAQHLVDRRGRTPLHCACAGFRTPNRPAVIHAYLKFDPSSSTVADEKGRTPFSLMYDDYAEEIDEVLHPSFDAERARAYCFEDGGALEECWKILVLLLKATYLGNVEEDLDAALSLFEVDLDDRNAKSSAIGEEKKNHSLSPARQRSDSTFRSSSRSSSKTLPSSTVRASPSMANNQVDLRNPEFQLLHAASACLYHCPHGFFQLLLKVCGLDRVKEHDADFHMPLHLAARAIPPASKSSGTVNPNRYSISSSFHGQSSTIYEEKSGVTINYYPNAVNGPGSRNHKNKQYTTTSFQPSESFTMHQTPIISHLLDIYPTAASVPDDHGKYPVLLAIESGKSYEYVIAPLLDAYPELLMGRLDDVGSCDTNTIDLETNITDEDMKIGASIDSPTLSASPDNASGIEAIQASLMSGLTNPSVRIRNETASTVGYLMKRISKMISKPPSLANPISAAASTNPKTFFKTDEFLREVIRTSGRYGSVHVNRRSILSLDNDRNTEWTGIQATMLHALSTALSNVSPNMIQIPATPQLAHDVASNMLKHEEIIVRECAACCIGAALELLPEEFSLATVDRIVLPQRKRRSVMELSMHSTGSCQSTGSFQTLNSADMSSGPSLSGTVKLIRSSSGTKNKNDLRIHRENLKLLKIEALHIRHGRALAYFHILTSSQGEFIATNEGIFHETLLLIQEMMLNDEAIVREAACLAMGSILGTCSDTVLTLKEVRHTLLKCMRPTEEATVHIALARGLMVATQMKPHIFISILGTPVLEGALVLCHQSAPNVQKMFHAFLWLALGIGDKDSAHYGLSEYMALAEGENGKIMMSLVTKTLAKIESVHDILWSSTVNGDEDILSAFV